MIRRTGKKEMKIHMRVIKIIFNNFNNMLVTVYGTTLVVRNIVSKSRVKKRLKQRNRKRTRWYMLDR